MTFRSFYFPLTNSENFMSSNDPFSIPEDDIILEWLLTFFYLKNRVWKIYCFVCIAKNNFLLLLFVQYRLQFATAVVKRLTKLWSEKNLLEMRLLHSQFIYSTFTSFRQKMYQRFVLRVVTCRADQRRRSVLQSVSYLHFELFKANAVVLINFLIYFFCD